MTTDNSRTSEYPIHPMFLNRWSPRAFADVSIEESDLLTMIEAGRWAASSYNAQPWRFIYARNGTADWTRFVDLLVPFNQIWAKNASALVILVSRKTMVLPGSEQTVPSYTHSLDAGAASAYFALQASLMGWFVHGMQGLDMERAAAELSIPEDFRVEAAYAVGKLGDKESLPEVLQAREQPSDRISLAELAFEGSYRTT